MSDEQGPAGLRDRKRPGPTIDLKATEIASEPVGAATEATSADARRPQANAPSGEKISRQQKAGWASRLYRTISSEPHRMFEHLSERVRMKFSRYVPHRFPWRLFSAFAAALVLAVVLVLLAGLVGRDNGRGGLEARLARLEQQQREMPAPPATPAFDPRITDDLAGRIARLESASPAPGFDPKITDDLAGRIARLESASPAPGFDPKITDDLSGRITKLEAAGATPTFDPRITDDLAARVARLEGAGVAPTLDPRMLNDLEGRVTKLEAVAAAPPPPPDPALMNRMATLESEFKVFDDKVGTAARRTDELGMTARDIAERTNAVAKMHADLSQKVAEIPHPTVGQGDLDPLAARIAALERSATAVDAELAKRAATEPGDRAARLAMFATALDTAAARGEPLGNSLTAVKALGVDPKALEPLEPFASSGVPAATVLGQELLTLLPALAKSVGTPPPREGGILDRLAANAEKLVRVRPIDDTSGDEPNTVLARIEARATQSDIAGALAALSQLPATARPIAAAWIAKAEARAAALAASRQLAVDTLGALGKGP